MKPIRMFIVSLIALIIMFFGAFYINSLIEPSVWYHAPLTMTLMYSVVACLGWAVISGVNLFSD